ncbi:hypothetical protein A0H81_15027 [Grifola frondosa]|uniref:Uncharacterized protein n=1 Tax=Grifola frondosa TaxID=5627 RepID=A0A1C7LJN2_GRIFR|nr:hypothetical protein A0H81_15027 [Grifola frondosa]
MSALTPVRSMPGLDHGLPPGHGVCRGLAGCEENPNRPDSCAKWFESRLRQSIWRRGSLARPILATTASPCRFPGGFRESDAPWLRRISLMDGIITG